jgi:hypothetical protein
MLGFQGTQAAHIATLYLGSDGLERSQALTDDPGDEGHHHGQQQDERYHDAERGGARQRLPNPPRLGDLNDSIGRL